MNALNKFNAALSHPNAGLLLLRLWLGVVGVFHGGQKLFGLFGGDGIEKFAGWLGSMNVPAPTASAYLAGGSEFFGGILIALGLLTRLAAIPFFIDMIVAILLVHTKAFSNASGGLEFPATLGAALFMLILTGPGQLSLDAKVLKMHL